MQNNVPTAYSAYWCVLWVGGGLSFQVAWNQIYGNTSTSVSELLSKYFEIKQLWRCQTQYVKRGARLRWVLECETERETQQRAQQCWPCTSHSIGSNSTWMLFGLASALLHDHRKVCHGQLWLCLLRYWSATYLLTNSKSSVLSMETESRSL